MDGAGDETRSDDTRSEDARSEDARPDDSRPVEGRRRGSRALAALLYGGTVVAGLAAPAIKRRLSRRLSPPVAELATTAGLIGVGWSSVIVAEQLRPFRPEWNRAHGDVATDALDVGTSAAATKVLGSLLALPVRRVMADRVRRGSSPLERLPLAARVVVTIHAVDLYHSVVHRIAHEWGPLWRVHAVHHSAPRLYWLNATRFHPVEMVMEGTAEAIVLSVLGAGEDTVLAHTVVRALYGQIQHGNVDLDSGVVNQVLATPERHRWHHSTVAAEGNTNYGAIVSTWDRLMGTDWLPEDRPFDAAVGVGGDPDYPQGWLDQLAAPFVRG